MRDGVLEAVTWLDGAEATGVGPDGVVVAPGFIDLHAHLREPGNEDAETVASGSGRGRSRRVHDRLRDAEHDAGARRAGRAGAAPRRRRRRGRRSSCSRTGRSRPGGQASSSRRSASWPTRVSSASRTTARRSGRPRSCAPRWPTPARSGCRSSSTPRTPSLTDGCRGERRLRRDRARAPRLAGRRRSPSAVARDLALLADVLRDVPGARLHLTHVSTAACARARPAAKAARCRSPATSRRITWRSPMNGSPGRVAGPGRPSGDPGLATLGDDTRRAAVCDPSLRVNPPLRCAEDAAACLAALLDGTADAIATDHAPHTRGRQGGRVRPGGQRDQRARDGAGRRPRGGRCRPAAAPPRDRGADDRTRGRARCPLAARGSVGLVEGARRTSSCSIAPSAGRSPLTASRPAARTRRCSGWSSSGRVLLTLAGGRLAYEAPDA